MKNFPFHSPSFFLLAISLFCATVMEATHRRNIPSRFGGEQVGTKCFTTEVPFQAVCQVNTYSHRNQHLQSAAIIKNSTN